MEIDMGHSVGPYDIIEQVGSGGMATVYKAWQRNMHRVVAIKMLPRLFSMDAVFVARFDREARTIASLEHARILPVYDYGSEDGVFYIVMRYLDSGTLAERIEKGPMPLAEVSRIITQIAEGLDYAHRRGVVHRDIKPSNVMLDDSNDVYITDFGLAKSIDGDNQITGSAVVGSPAYMSPEQGVGQELDARSDIYSLGIVLYEMVVGETPFDATTPMALVMKHINEPPPPPTSLNLDVPKEVEDIIFRAIEKNPDDRFQSAKDLARALTQFVSEQVVDVVPPGGGRIPSQSSFVRPQMIAKPWTMQIEPAGAAEQTVQKQPDDKKFPVVPVIFGVLAVMGVVALISAFVAVRGMTDNADQTEPPRLVQSEVSVGSESTLPENPIFVQTFDDEEALSSQWRLSDEGVQQELRNGQITAYLDGTNEIGWGAFVNVDAILSTAGLTVGDTYYVRTDVTFVPGAISQAAGLVIVNRSQDAVFSFTRQYCDPERVAGCSGDDIVFNDLRSTGTRLDALVERETRIQANAPDLSNDPVALALVFRSGAVDAYYSVDQGNSWRQVTSATQLFDLTISGIGVVLRGLGTSSEASFDNFVIDSGLPEFATSSEE